MFQILKADIVHREEGCRGAVLWTHVGDGGSVSDRQLSHTWAEELHEFSYNAHLTEVLRAHTERTAMRSVMLSTDCCAATAASTPSYLGNSKHDVGGRDELVCSAVHLVAHHLGEHHADWLTQHNSFCFNPTHT